MMRSKTLLSIIMPIQAFMPSTSFLSTTATRKITRVAKRRYPISPCMDTQYTINDSICPPLDETELKDTVQKRCETLETFLTKRPIAGHTQAAFDQIIPNIQPDSKIILDSGCGTARSTLILGEMYPDHTIIGIDRSIIRLSKNKIGKEQALKENGASEEEDNELPFNVVSSNVILVRADLTDFWRCCLDAKWEISKHFLLYPNPCPKKKVFKNRWYAHPSFPLILKLGGEILIRSNWEGYLKEFSKSVGYAHDFYSNQKTVNFALPYLEDARSGPVERLDKTIALTNFEMKYDACGERTYELLLRRRTESSNSTSQNQ